MSLSGTDPQQLRLRVGEGGEVTRRSVLRVSAWAVPVVAVAVAAPLAAASGPVRRAAVVYPGLINAASYSPGTISINDTDIRYDYARWGLTGQEESQGPETATVMLRFAVLRAADLVEIASADGGPLAVAKYGDDHANGQLPGLPAGTYVLRLIVTSVTFSPSSLPYTFEADVPQSADSAPIVVA